MKKFDLKIFRINKANEREIEDIAKYWRNFFQSFSDFMYYDQDHYDNHVWGVIRSFKTFLNYLNKDLHLGIGEFHKSFRIPSENIPIIVLSPEQMNQLIYDDQFHRELSKEMKVVKDIFVFGCTVALRFGDLISITHQNIYEYSGNTYLKVTSLKTATPTSMKLPDYALKIVKKYSKKSRIRIFPKYSNARFNVLIKVLARKMKLNTEIKKYRSKRGVKFPIYKNKTTKKHFTMADHITTHTMRRTAITTMLRLHVPEQIVRKISGHSANSAEFFKYVEFAQSYLDEHTEVYFEKMKNMRKE